MRHPCTLLAITLMLVVGVLVSLTGQGRAELVLYDDFASGVIDPAKWAGQSGEGTFNGPSTEVTRRIENGQLRLSLTSYGDTNSDAGGIFSNQTLSMKELGIPGGTGFITSVTARITVLNAIAQGCAANPNPENTAPRVELAGAFFNDGSSTGPTDQTGDVRVYVIVVLDGFGNHRINAGLQRCPNATCQGAVGIGGVQFATTWAVNTPIPVRIVWREAAGKFRFVANGEVRDVFYPVGTIAAGPPVRDFKQLDVRNFVENCTKKRKRAVMDALFDDVQVERQP